MFKTHKLLLLFLLISPKFILAHDHHHDHSDKDIETALQLFEKAYQLSPDLLPQVNSSPNSNNLVPYYKMRGEKIPLTQSSVLLMREWVHIFADEIERHCDDCDIDRETLLEEAVKNELLVKEAKDYAPENRLVKIVTDKTINRAEDLGHLSVHYTAKYGKMIAGLIGIVEAFETMASFMMGLKGVHLICTPLQILIVPTGRKIQRYGRTLFDYGFNLSHASLLLTSKMAWTTRTLHKRTKKTFFYIDKALEFNENQLEKVNQEGPISLFHPQGHRFLWLERLKKKTDPLFLKIDKLKTELEQPNLTEKKKNKLEKQIQTTRNKIENLTKINRKEFFGSRFKRYLFLKSRKGRKAYMDGLDLKSFDFIHKILGSRNISWPLAPQFMIEQTLEKESYRKDTLLGNSKTPVSKQSDDVISGLVDEFLNQKSIPNKNNQRREAVHFFISDFHNLFDTNQTSASRVMSATALEALLTQFFAHYLKLAEDQITSGDSISYRTKIKIYSKIGKIQNFAMQFTDFLMSIAFSANSDKVNFYKYESIEKFFAFLNYFDQIGQIIKQNLSMQEILLQINQAEEKVKSFSITREKNSKVNLIPFKKSKGKCYEITRKY